MAGFYTGFGSTSSSLSSQASSVQIFPIPYSFAPINPYTMFDPNFGMTGSYASNDIVNGTIITCQLCRKIGHGAKTCTILSSFGKGGYNGGFSRNTSGNGNGNIISCQLCKQIGHGAKTCRILSSFGKGGYNGGFSRNTSGNGNGNIISCQLCKQIGHGAKTCSTLSYFGKGGYNGGNGNGNTITCQLCKQIGHGAKTCSTLQQGNTLNGFPNQQERNLLGNASSMISAGYKGSVQVEKVSSLQSQSHLNITVPTCFPLTQSSCQPLVPAPVLSYSTTARLPPSVIVSSNPETSNSANLAKRQYDQVHDRFLNLTSEKDAIQLVNQELNAKVMELQKIQESVMVQLSAKCSIARERIQKLESEAEALVSKKMETEKLVSELELKIDFLSESSRSSEHKIQYLLLKLSALETENKDNAEKLQAEIWKKAEQIVGLLKEGETHEQHVDSTDKQLSQLHITLEEKEQLSQQYKEREKNLENQILENRTLLTAAETRIVEDKKKYDLMLESKQLELSRHLNDICQRNDHVISDIQKKYEVEKVEIVNFEKQKAEKLFEETERECKNKLEECAQGDLVVGLWLYMWVNLLLPLLSNKSGCNPQSRDLILQSVERILQFRDLKEIALAGSPEGKIMRQVAQKTLNYSIEAVKEGIPDLSKEANAIFIWCLTQRPKCYKQWDMHYLDNIDSSVIVLKKLSEKTLAKGDDLVNHSLLKDADKYCKLIMHLYVRIFVNLELQCSRTVASMYLLMMLLIFLDAYSHDCYLCSTYPLVSQLEDWFPPSS